MHHAETVRIHSTKEQKCKKSRLEYFRTNKVIVSYYAEYSEYSEEEVVDEFLQRNLIKDEHFIEWINSRRNNKRMLKAIGIDE